MIKTRGTSFNINEKNRSMPVIKGNSIAFLRDICQKKMKDYYAAGIPEAVNRRVEEELSYIEHNHSEDVYRVYYVFQKAAEEKSLFLTSLAATGNLMVTFLLGNSPFDPMEPYLYCSSCGYFERIHDGRINASDENKCPKCRSGLEVRGYGLPMIFEFGSKKNPRHRRTFEYHYEEGLLPDLIRVLSDLYPENQVVKELNPEKTTYVGLAVLPENKSLNVDYSELLVIGPDGEEAICGDGFVIEKSNILRILTLEMHKRDKKVLIPPRETQESIFGYLTNRGIEPEDAYDILHFMSIKWNSGRKSEQKLIEMYDQYALSEEIRVGLTKILIDTNGYFPHRIGDLTKNWMSC